MGWAASRRRAGVQLRALGIVTSLIQRAAPDRSRTWRYMLRISLFWTLTAPFIRRDDGSFLMDSVEIALCAPASCFAPPFWTTSCLHVESLRWLDRTYPDRQNLLLPEAGLPVDVSAEYRQAVSALQGAPLAAVLRRQMPHTPDAARFAWRQRSSSSETRSMRRFSSCTGLGLPRCSIQR